ncbi:MAG: glycosyltransferase [Microthrixaceae bacterium]
MPTPPALTVVVPAHDESELLPSCLRAIRISVERAGVRAETVVVANRCHDDTAELAERAGARLVVDDHRNLSAVRNAGIDAARGRAVVTVDADCRMHPRTIRTALGFLAGGAHVGGAVKVRPERRSPGIDASYAVVELLTAVTGLGGGVFWAGRRDLHAIGGFDESLLVGEDLDLARRLRRHGRRTGRRFAILTGCPLVASCRKFDRYGDWHMFALARELPAIRAAANGTDTAWVDEYFFDFNG